MKDLIFVVQAYDSEDGVGNLNYVCELQLFCKSERVALKRAKKLIKKNNYRVSKIVEKYKEK